MIAVIAGTPVSPPVAASYPDLLLEDFATSRLGTTGADLWNIYLGEDPGQTGGYDGTNNWFAVDVPVNDDIYVDFRPLNYNVEAGHARYYIKSGAWDNVYNRLSFWMRSDATSNTSGVGNAGLYHFGTYVRTEGADPANQGDHYYHFLNPKMTANRWVKCIVNKHPQHQVGQSPGTNWGDNPTSGSFDYFYGLTRFYVDGVGNGNPLQAGEYILDDFYFAYDDDHLDSHIASVSLGYNGTSYNVSWYSLKHQVVNFTVYVSDVSMKTNGIGAGTSIGTVATPGSDYSDCQLVSGAMSEYAGGTYFAIVPAGDIGFSEYFLENRS